MTATIEQRNSQNVLDTLPSPDEAAANLAKKHDITPLGQDFLHYTGQSGLWLAHQPMMPDRMMEGIAQWGEQHWAEGSSKLGHIVVPYNGEPVLSPDLFETFNMYGVEIHPVQMSPSSLRHNKSDAPRNLITVTPSQVDRVARRYQADNERYSISSGIAGWPTLIAIAGLKKLGAQEGNVAIFSAHHDKPSTLPPQTYLPGFSRSS